MMQWKRLLKTPPRPGFQVMTVFVTSRCGLDCEGCFYGDELNNDKVELTLDEYRQLADNIGPFQGLLLSGGEPFLRKELPEIVQIFRERCGIHTVDMPTAGVNTPRVEAHVRRVCEISPELKATLGVSFDGPPDYHDRYRKGKRVYEHAVRTLQRMTELKAEYPNLTTNVLSCATKENVHLLPKMWEELSSIVEPDFWGVELVRPFSRGASFSPPSLEEIRELHRFVIDVNRRLIERNFPGEEALRMSHLETVYRYQENFYEKGATGVPCLAGQTIGAIMPDGEVKLCEVLESVGHLRESGGDWQSIWKSARADRQRASILRGDCACTHCVNLGQSLIHDEGAQKYRSKRERELAREREKVKQAG